MSKRFKDFDEAFAEEYSEKLIARIGGVEYEFPPAIPASIVLTFFRDKDEGDGFDPYAWIETIVGAEKMAEMVKGGVTWDQFDMLTKWLLAEYGMGGSVESDENEEVEDGESSPSPS